METQTAGPRQPARLPALDFTKGALVLIMVLYHWLNYFISPVGDFYKYLRFLTPSFIFISGFLISHIYLVRYQSNDASIPERLLQRGLKILGVFIFLNVMRSFVIPDVRGGIMPAKPWAVQNLITTYVTGNVSAVATGKTAAFFILVPISYLLLLSAGLAVLSRWWKYTFQAVCISLLAAILVLSLNGLGYGNLELLTAGLMGAVVGYFPTEKIIEVLSHKTALVVAYLLFTVALTIWAINFWVQIVGVFLNVMLIFVLGSSDQAQGSAGAVVRLLGKYSLFGYIIQIAILQLLYRGLRPLKLGKIELMVSFLAAFVLTIVGVKVLDRVRARSAMVNRAYAAVFA